MVSYFFSGQEVSFFFFNSVIYKELTLKFFILPHSYILTHPKIL